MLLYWNHLAFTSLSSLSDRNTFQWKQSNNAIIAIVSTNANRKLVNVLVTQALFTKIIDWVQSLRNLMLCNCIDGFTFYYCLNHSISRERFPGEWCAFMRQFWESLNYNEFEWLENFETFSDICRKHCWL